MTLAQAVRNREVDGPAFVCTLLVGLACLSACWGEAVMNIALALAVLVAMFWRPPRLGALGVSRWLLGVLAVAPLVALVPLHPFGLPWWRALIMEELPGDLGWTTSPQPFAILSQLSRWWIVLLWVWWVSSQRCRPEASRSVVAAGWLIAVVTAILLSSQRWVSGFWDGPYRGILDLVVGTRNQAGAIATMALVCSVAGGLARWGGTRIWWVGSLPAMAALLALGSRGAALFALMGVGVTWCMTVYVLRRRRGVHWNAFLLIAVLVIAILVTSPGAPLLQRFGFGGVSERIASQLDGWIVLFHFPATGCGLGSYPVAVSFYGNSASNPTPTFIHPESDWLWLATQVGLLPGLVAVCLVVLFLLRWARVRTGTGAPLACGCGVAVLGHGLLDVPLHAPLTMILFVAFVAIGAPGSTSSPNRMGFLFSIAVFLLAIFVQHPQRPMSSPFVLADEVNRTELTDWLRVYPLDAMALATLGKHKVDAGDDQGWSLLRASILLRPRDPLLRQQIQILADKHDRQEEIKGFEIERGTPIPPRK